LNEIFVEHLHAGTDRKGEDLVLKRFRTAHRFYGGKMQSPKAECSLMLTVWYTQRIQDFRHQFAMIKKRLMNSPTWELRGVVAIRRAY
jgi:hypothetical protein